MRTMKKMLTVGLLAFGLSGTFMPRVSANHLSIPNQSEGISVYVNEQELSRLSIETQENLVALIQKSMSEAGTVTLGNNEIVPINDEVYAEITVEKGMIGGTGFRSFNGRVWGNSTYHLKNILGMNIVTLRAHGVYDVNGRYATAVDSYGSYQGLLWDLSTSSSHYGNTARTLFQGKFNIGVDPVSMTVSTFSINGLVYCDKNGIVTANWW